MLDSHKYVIFTDSTSDLSQDIIDKYSINVIPIELSIDGKAFIKDYEISPKDFYGKLTAKILHSKIAQLIMIIYYVKYYQI